jgi:hypothetical protein
MKQAREKLGKDQGGITMSKRQMLAFNTALQTGKVASFPDGRYAGRSGVPCRLDQLPAISDQSKELQIGHSVDRSSRESRYPRSFSDLDSPTGI